MKAGGADECLNPARGGRARLGTICYISGTGTGVGKSVLTALLLCHLRHSGVNAHALKPISTGDRGDAALMRAALGRKCRLETINPIHFRKPVAPVLAARMEGRRIELETVVNLVERSASKCKVLLVEGAGGWCTPLGERFGLSEVHRRTGGGIILVAANELGALHNVRSTILAMGEQSSSLCAVVLSERCIDDSSASNAKMLKEFGVRCRVVKLENIGKQGIGNWPFERGEKISKKLLRDLGSLIDSSRCPALRCAAKK